MHFSFDINFYMLTFFQTSKTWTFPLETFVFYVLVILEGLCLISSYNFFHSLHVHFFLCLHVIVLCNYIVRHRLDI
jgi:hypothetical protein